MSYTQPHVIVQLGDKAVNVNKVLYCDRSSKDKNISHLMLTGGRTIIVGLPLEEVVRRLNGDDDG